MSNKPTLPNLRSSAIKMFEACPAQWRHEYLEGNKQESGPWAVIGTAAHKIVEDYLTGRHETPGDHPELINIPDPKEKEMTVAYALSKEGKRSRLMGTEMRFVLDFKGVPLEVTFDALYWHPGDVLEIEDHKTNRAYEGVEVWSKKIQQVLYPAVARLLYPQARQVRMAIGYVLLGKTIEWVSNSEDDVELWERVDKALQGMKGKKHEEKVDEHCRFCPRRPTCGSYQDAINGLASSIIPLLRKEHPAERFSRLKGLKKLVETEIEDAQTQLFEIVEAEGTVIVGGNEWSIGYESSRSAPSFVDLWRAMMGSNGYDEDAAKALMALGDELFSVKLGGLDLLVKGNTEAELRAGPLVQKSYTPKLKPKAVKKITEKTSKKAPRKKKTR